MSTAEKNNQGLENVKDRSQRHGDRPQQGGDSSQGHETPGTEFTGAGAPGELLHAEQIGADMQRLLADTYVAFNTAQIGHWNVEGPLFEQLHAFFEKQYRDLFEGIDAIAERVRKMGFFTDATLQHIVHNSRLSSVSIGASPDALLTGLNEQYRQIAVWLRDAVDRASSGGDQGSVDLYVERLRWHEKSMWMINSLLGNRSSVLLSF